ncbi:MAG: alpha/beta hydrolase [Sandaracinus sp.]
MKSHAPSVVYDETRFAQGPDGTRLFYGTLGPREAPVPGAPWMVLSDGIGCDGFAWKYLAPYLAKRYRVLHWHYRAHGRSGAPVDPVRIDMTAHARDLVAVLEHAGIERAVLFGHSMGTQVALETYRHAHDRVAALALLCGSYGRITTTFHGSDALAQVLPTIIELVEANEGLVRAVWGRIPAGLAYRIARLTREVDGIALREEDFRWYVDHVSAMEPKTFLAMLHLAGEHSADDLLPTIDVPTLVIAAERDTFTPAALARHMAESITGGELFELRGASHAAPVEQPVAVELRIDKFLEERVLPAERHREGAAPSTDP